MNFLKRFFKIDPYPGYQPLNNGDHHLPSYEEVINNNHRFSPGTHGFERQASDNNIEDINKDKYEGPTVIRCSQDFSATQCSRCPNGIVSIRVNSHDGFKEYMCLDCKNKDPQLLGIRVKPIIDNDTDLVHIYNAIPKPDSCERCMKDTPDIRLLNKTKGTIEFICHKCRLNDNSIKKSPIHSWSNKK